MLKVVPSNFAFFKNPGDSRNILTPSGEPLAICCSNECLFVAVEACLLEAYQLRSWQLLGQFRTIDTVQQLAYSGHGDCILTLERKPGAQLSFARVYFKWRGSSVEKPVRVNLLSSLTPGAEAEAEAGAAAHRIAAEIVELPSNDSAFYLACCQHSGRVAMVMGDTIRLFSLGVKGACSEATPTPSIELLLDVCLATAPIKQVAIFGDNLAFITSHEACVLRLSLVGEDAMVTEDFHFHGGEEDKMEASDDLTLPKDQSFVSWSPSLGWKAEKESAAYSATRDGHVTSHGTNPRPPVIGSVSLASMTCSGQAKRRESQREVLGPTEDIIGGPLEVELHSSSYQHCRVLTMLHRSFPSAPPLTRSFSLGSKVTQTTVAEEGLHTVQLVPTMVESEGGSGEEVGGTQDLTCQFILILPPHSWSAGGGPSLLPG